MNTAMLAINTSILAIALLVAIRHAKPQNRIQPKPRADKTLRQLATCFFGTIASAVCTAVAAFHNLWWTAFLGILAAATGIEACRRIINHTAAAWEQEKDEKAAALIPFSAGKYAMTLRISKNENKEWPPFRLEVSDGRLTFPGRKSLRKCLRSKIGKQ